MPDSGLETQLTKGKVGPVPVWAAGAMFAVLFFGYMVYRNRRNTPTTTVPPTVPVPDTTTPDPNQPAGYGLPPGPIGDFLANNPAGAQYPVGLPAQGLPAPITNVQWSRLVSDELLAKGDDPALVSSALTKYLSGQALTEAEQAVVNMALQIFGAPPEGLIPVSTPSANPTPGTNPYKDNNAWLQAALAWFGSQPNYAGTSPTNAQIALTDYINGKPLGLWEQWTVNTVITGTNQLGKNYGKGIGPPPEVPSVSYR